MEPHGLAHAPPYPVANHRLAHRAGNRKADFGSLAIRAARIESREQRPGIPGALIINSTEISGSQNTDTFGKTCDVTTSRS